MNILFCLLQLVKIINHANIYIYILINIIYVIINEKYQ